MIYLPYGQRKGGVVDPDGITRDYQQAMRITNQTTHFQWGEDAVSEYVSMVEFTIDSTSVALGGEGDGTQGGVALQLLGD